MSTGAWQDLLCAALPQNTFPPARAAPARVPFPRSTRAGGLAHAGTPLCRELKQHVRLHGELLKAEEYKRVAVF